jgi:hypothetical protein
MKKMLIQEDEKSQILQKHQDFKKVLQENLESLNRGLIQEQLKTGVVSDQILDGAIAAGCVTGGQVIRYGGKPTYYKVATKDNAQKYIIGDKLLINADFTYDVLSKDNVKKGTYKWACPNMNAASEKVQKQSVEDLKTEYKTKYGAQEFTELTYKTKSDDPTFYKKIPFKGVDTGFLYIPQFKKEFLATDVNDYAEGTPEREILDGLVSKGYVLNPTPLQKTSFRQQKLDKDNPELGGLFPNGIVVYIDPRGLFNKTSKDAEGKPLTMTGQINPKECKTLINQYWENYRDDISGDAIEFNKMKAQVMACKRRYYPNRWGLLGLAGNQIDKKIDVLSRKANEFDGVITPSRTSKWLLN